MPPTSIGAEKITVAETKGVDSYLPALSPGSQKIDQTCKIGEFPPPELRYMYDEAVPRPSRAVFCACVTYDLSFLDYISKVPWEKEFKA